MMRFTQIVLLGAASVAFSGLASATPCNTAGYTATTLNAGLQCEVGDKIFTFAVTTAFAAPTTTSGTAIVTFSGPGGSPYLGGYNVIVSDSLGGALSSGFTLNYSVAIDTALAAQNYISAFASGILDSSTVASVASNSATLSGGASCTAGTTDNNDTLTPTGNCGGLHATALVNVHDVFTFGTVGDGLSSVSNTFTEAVASGVPEPTTFVLMGAGLGLIGMLRRKTARR